MSTINVELRMDNGQFTAGINQATQGLGQFNQRLAQTSQAYAALIQRLQSNNAVQGSLFSTQQITQFQNALGNVTTAAANAGGGVNNLNNNSRGLLATMRDLTFVVGGVSLLFAKVANVSQSWVGDIVRLNAQMERLNFQMRGMSTAADPIKDAADNIGYLQEQSKEMPFALKTITDGFVKMKATGIDPMAGGLQSLADGVAAAGGNDEQFQRAILAVTQMSGKGVIQMEELRQQLGEAMPRAVELMARSMGVSMSTMIKEIGRGTVEAKPALEAFFAEVSRTYGGQALLMMQTFTGQIQRVQTTLQQLATTGSIKTNFFDGALRKQLDDLNRFLSSDAAVQWRDKLGNALASGVNGLRWFLDTVIEFRSELGRLAAVIASVFAFKAAFAAMSSLMGFIDTTRGRLTALSAAFATLQTSMSMATIQANSGAPAMMVLGSRMSVLGNVVRTGIAAFTAYAPLIGLAAMAAFTAAEYFGLLSNKTLEAYESLKKYGAESKKQADETVAARRKQLEADLLIAERLAKGEEQRYGVIPPDMVEQINEAKQALAAFNAESKDVLAKASDAEASKKLDEFKLAIGKKLNEIQVEYDRAGIEFAKKWDQREREAAESLQSVDMVRADRQKETAENQKALYANQVAALEEYLAQQTTVLAKLREADRPDEQQIKNYQQRINYLRQMIQEAQTTAANLGAVGVPRVAQTKDEQALFEKGVANLNKMRAELAGLKEEADGGYGAVVRLQQELAAGKYGPTGSPMVQKLIAETIEVKKQIEAQKQINREIERRERLYENGQDKLAKMRSEITGMLAGLQGVNQDAAELRSLAENGFFGDEDTQKVKDLADALADAAEAKAELDKMMKGKEKLESDLEAARVRMIERRLELEYKARGDELTETEKIKIKFEQGIYDGFGPSSPTAAVFAALAKSWEVQKTAAESVGDAVRNQAFGDQTRQSIMSTTQSLREMAGVLQGIKGLSTGMNFSNWSTSTSLMGANPNATPFKFDTGSGIFELIKKVESGGDYNMTLDNGRWTNGPQNLTSMTINQIRDLQRSMLTPENQAVHGDGGSSALGAYQIVGKTLEGLKAKMGLTGEELFDQEMQDRMAAVLLQGRQGQGIEGLRNEWEGLKNVDAATINAALASRKGPTIANAVNADVTTGVPAVEPVQSAADQIKTIWTDLTKTLTEQMDKQIQEEEKLQQDESAAERVSDLKLLKERAQDAQRPIEELGKNYGELIEKIRTGGYGAKSSRDPQAEEYKEMLEAAKQLDELEKKRDETIKAQTAGKTQLKNLTEKEAEFARRAQDAMARFKNPDARVESDEYRKLEQDLTEYVASQKRAYGETSQAAVDAETYKQNMLRQLRGTESAELAAKYQKEATDIRQANMTTTQSRYAELQRQLAQIDQEVAAFAGSEEQKVALVAAAEKKKAALRAQYAQQDPMGAKLKEWGDLQGNLATSAAGWMDSLSGGLADVIMGTGDLKTVIQGIVRDLLNMGIKYMMSSMLQGAKGGATSKGSAVAKGGTKAATGGKVGVAHTGGIIGSSGLAQRFVSGSIFKNAPKFHTGGVIGMPRLRSDEVPIIAQKGEGVFTADQMKALGRSAGGGQMININSPVTVNAAGGTPEQNADLARQVAKAHETSMRALVRQEVFNMQKPGNILNK